MHDWVLCHYGIMYFVSSEKEETVSIDEKCHAVKHYHKFRGKSALSSCAFFFLFLEKRGEQGIDGKEEKRREKTLRKIISMCYSIVMLWIVALTCIHFIIIFSFPLHPCTFIHSSYAFKKRIEERRVILFKSGLMFIAIVEIEDKIRNERQHGWRNRQ